MGSLFRLGHPDPSSDPNCFRVSQGRSVSNVADRSVSNVAELSTRKTVNVEILRQASEMEGEGIPVIASLTSPTHLSYLL